MIERRLLMQSRTLATMRTVLAALAGLLLSASPVHAQWIPAGSTPQGDYLRGLGIAAWGLGSYNLNTAQAESINVDTAIRLNDYINAVAESSRRAYVERRAAESAELKSNYDKIRQRIRESPEERDVENGDSLNAVLQQMLDAKVDDSSFRFNAFQVPLPVDFIRKIPFKLSEKGEKFSMNRLTVKGKAKWPVAFQDDRLDRPRQAYERAVDKALEQAVDGKMQKATIDDIQVRAEDLFFRLNEVFGPSDEPRYIEAKQRIADLKSTARLLTRYQIEQAIAEIDKYSGTTVRDLMLFMQSHNLRFAAAGTPEERRLYPELYAFLIQQRDKIPGPQKEPVK
jgi:hypothetical protein